MKRLLVVFAHPDDETFICGGTMAKYAAEGVHIELVCATRGEMGRRMGQPAFATRQTLPALREQELRDACEILGIQTLRFLDIIDKSVHEHVQGVAAHVVARVRESRPDAIVTFTTKSGFAGHPDHRAIAESVLAAYEELRGEFPDLPIYGVCGRGEANAPSELGVRPEQIVRVDVSEYARPKLLAFRAHKTQSQQETRIWDADEKVTPYMGEPECFVQLTGTFASGKTELL